MKKLKSSLTNMLVVLTVITIVAAGVLASVNAVTAPQIEKINAENLAAGIKAVMGNDDIKVSEPWEVDAFTAYDINDKQGNLLGKAVVTTENGFGGPLKVLVGFNTDGDILGYTVLEHAETPGLGAKAGEWFQDKIIIQVRTTSQSAKTVAKWMPSQLPPSPAARSSVPSRMPMTRSSRVRMSPQAPLNRPLLPIWELQKQLNNPQKKGTEIMNNFKVLVNGIIKENPTFVLLLGMCPTLGTTSSAINGMSMGLATMCVLILSNLIIASIKPTSWSSPVL